MALTTPATVQNPASILPVDAKDRSRLEEETRAKFEQLVREAELQPGVVDLLRVYGGYEYALRQIDAYLAAANPQPVFSTSNSSAS